MNEDVIHVDGCWKCGKMAKVHTRLALGQPFEFCSNCDPLHNPMSETNIMLAVLDGEVMDDLLGD